MTSKHTPGPWWRDDSGFVAAGSGESYVTIADFDCSDLDICEREANKALALEAPAMVAALRQVVNLAELHIAERSATPEEEEDFLSCAYLVNARAILSRIDVAAYLKDGNTISGPRPRNVY